MKNCYFCGAKAPEIRFQEKKTLDGGNLEGILGVYSVECSCGRKIVHDVE